MNVEDWCDEFLIAYNTATQLELPDVHGFRAHKDLIRAIKQIDSGYAAIVSSSVIKAERIWNTDRNIPIPESAQLSTVLTDFLHHYRITYSTKTNIHGGVFGATLSQDESPYKNNKKRSRHDATPSRPCLCGEMHFWGQCLYIDPSLRLRGFVEDPEKVKKIKDYEAKDNKGILNQIREKNRSYKKRQTDADKPAEPDSIEIDAGDPPADQLTQYT
jgi:hypothetical protein